MPNKRGPKPRRQHITWSTDLAYAIGLITTDGNLSPDGRHIELTSADIDLIETFKRCLGLTNRIGTKHGGFLHRTTAYRIQFGDVVLYDFLASIGLMPNKSLQLGALQIPDEFFFDFLRGCIDGDGSYRVYQDPDYPNSQRLYIVLISASLDFLQWIQQRTIALASVDGYIESVPRAYHLTFAKRDSLVLLKLMYPYSQVPCLARKRILIEKFLL